MKTLDEVIKANECCDHGEPDSRCEECPYNGLGACALERELDTLHYLKMYKELTDTEWAENPPLKWQELRKMFDEPIWVEERDMCDDPFEGNWRLIDDFGKINDSEYMRVSTSELGSYILKQEDMGEYWQAYRKVRE